MNSQLLNQYNIKLVKVYSLGRYSYKAEGKGIAMYLINLGRDLEEINEALEKANFFINGNTGNPTLIQEMESHHYNSVWADFDYQSAYISEEFGGAGYNQILPLQDFKNILLMWQEFVET